jgi:extradiol dioxygenase family protein
LSGLPIFHLAFPVGHVTETVSFYRDRLGCRVDLVEKNRCIINFWGHQLVAHLSAADVPNSVRMYPRHFGVIFDRAEEFEALLKRATDEGVNFFEKHFHRFAGTPREHRTFFLTDPFNNLLEFKWYRNADLILKAAPSDSAA